MTDQLVVGGQLGNYLIDSVIGRGGNAAAANPRSAGRALVYTASLLNSAAQSVPTRGVFLWHVGEATAALPETRRQADTSSAA